TAPNSRLPTAIPPPTHSVSEKIGDSPSLECYFDSTRYLTEINNPFAADAYPWLSSDGLRLYFTKQNNGEQLSLAKRNNLQSPFQMPVNVPLPDFGASLTSCWLSENELGVYFCGGGQLYYSSRQSLNDGFTSYVPVTLLGLKPEFLAGASLNEAGTELFLYTYTHPNGYISQYAKVAEHAFLFQRYLTLPDGYGANPGQLSKDDLSIYFGLQVDSVNRVIARMTRPTPVDTFALETLELIPGVSQDGIYNAMPTLSADEKWMVFVRATADAWEANELCITQCDSNLVSVFAPETGRWSVYPNPTNNVVYITGPLEGELRADIISIGGAIIQSETLDVVASNRELHLGNLPVGLYFLKLYSDNQVLGVKKLVKNQE
ncbi:MAG: T9SS type A sorting domain-containing protein, partial [Saprospiraceae bacterium]|nr:T9SS type A sorting domain-containing protein [Saprospiraceae bacterium]